MHAYTKMTTIWTWSSGALRRLLAMGVIICECISGDAEFKRLLLLEPRLRQAVSSMMWGGRVLIDLAASPSIVWTLWISASMQWLQCLIFSISHKLKAVQIFYCSFYPHGEGGPLTHCSWWENIVNWKTPRGGGFFRSNVYSEIWGPKISEIELGRKRIYSLLRFLHSWHGSTNVLATNRQIVAANFLDQASKLQKRHFRDFSQAKMS